MRRCLLLLSCAFLPLATPTPRVGLAPVLGLGRAYRNSVAGDGAALPLPATGAYLRPAAADALPAAGGAGRVGLGRPLPLPVVSRQHDASVRLPATGLGRALVACLPLPPVAWPALVRRARRNVLRWRRAPAPYL